MPTYGYKCRNDHYFEAMQPMSEDALEACEICGAPATRVLFAPAVHFKGSGFYTTDYARKGPASGANASDGEGSKPDSKDSKSGSKSGSSNDSGGGSSDSSSSSSSSKSESKAASGSGKGNGKGD